MNKLIVMMLVCFGVFSVNISANAEVLEIDSGLNVQKLTTGDYWWATVVNCNEWISLRREPSVYSERIYAIPLGTTVKIYTGVFRDSGSPTNGFYRTYYNGAWGWCLQEYIRKGQHIGSSM